MLNHFIFFALIIFGYTFILVGSVLSSVYLIETVFWESGSVSMVFSVLVDYMSLVFIGTVMVIGGSVLIYTSWYMSDELYYKRFVSLVLLFILSMVLMILIPNLIGILIGWDGLGLTSFLLVCYYCNSKSLAASLLTALTNRIGDVLILMSIGFMIVENSWSLYQFTFGETISGLVGLLTFAAMTKSAQMPFCAWLPAAMAAPTPVSALVHSSTLVTAGVYLLIRSFKVISLDPMFMEVLEVLSLVTLCLAGTSALVCLDLKKVVALSTLSQLSVMMLSISLYAPVLAFFHLITHALFKALLFLSVGSVIHSYGNIQDIRMVGGCWSTLPKSMSAMVIAVSSLSGLPFLSGFFSKDLIVDLCYSSSMSLMEVVLVGVGIAMTSVYSLRMVWSSLFSLNMGVSPVMSSDEKLELTFPYLCLSLGALFVGYVLSGQIMGVSQFSGSSNFEIVVLVGAFLLGLFFMWANSGSLQFNLLFLFLYKKSSAFLSMLLKLVRHCFPFLLSMWCLEIVSSQVLAGVSLSLSEKLSSSLDNGWLETIGPQGMMSNLMSVSQNNEQLQKGFFMSCLGGVVSCVLVLFFFVALLF
nr:NADH dehydrogenase subunit 5 [Arcuatula senhousia]